MIVYTKINNEDELNVFHILFSSFREHHPDWSLHVLTDLELPKMSGLVQHDRFFDIETLDKFFCFVSPYLCFFDSIECLLKEPRSSLYQPNMREAVREDFYIYDKTNRVTNKSQGEDDLVNMSLPPYMDWGTVIQYRQLSSVTPVINTREFEPWRLQRNSGKTLIFPWERYFMSVKKAAGKVDEKFVEDVVENCKRHPYMLFYQLSGVLDPWTE